jgi:hypothetical protein
MKTLSDHCTKFHAAIFTDVDAPERNLQTDLVPAGTLSLNEAFEVYREGHSARAVEALGEIYETLWMFLGDEDFFEIVEQYIETYPSKFQNLSHWGKDFPKFLEESEADTVIVELARFCWIQNEVFHSASKEFDIQEVPNLKFQAQFRILKSPVNLLPLWNAIRNDEDFEGELFEPSETVIFLSDRRVSLASLTVDADFLYAVRDCTHSNKLSLEELFASMPPEIMSGEKIADEIQLLFQHLRELGLFFESANAP